MSLLVMKFGGTSVGSAQAIASVARINQEQRSHWDSTIVVVSAMSGVTDMLIQSAHTAASGDRETYRNIALTLRTQHAAVLTELVGPTEDAVHTRAQIEQLVDEFEMLCGSVNILGEVSARALDAIASLGERMSARVVAATIRAHNTPSEAVDANECIVTNDHFGNAIPLQQPSRALIQARLRPLLDQGITPIVTGFMGATESGVTTTLGRGGSDYSGAIIGSGLDADEVAIYTDVDGVMTSDPRLVPDAHVIPELSYAEMGELAYFGAKVVHPRTVRPVVERNISLRIRNTFNPSHMGTRVVRHIADNTRTVKAVTAIRGMSLITVEGRGMIGVPGVAARTFGAVASIGANVLMISQASSEQSICFIIPMAASGGVVRALETGLANELTRRDIDRISVRDGIVIVTAVGSGMRDKPGVASQIFGVLAEQDINVVAIAQGSSECAISAAVSGADGDRAIQAIHTLTVA
ncbi:MAG: aspartate kinase [Chloroflexi bacterium AL-W]|nr:aspartate kinase [Chloroflexi bacterium AL-N1]NOK65686.1 aspartate kinase [Chloroflexi bacterium AL-N10]NOK74373.1 aspartate kinase [Chloroflexi bacterium AL-N5]NOK80719.1 aspartate kinase [Chloroflexi bacterium AL-W]NOK88631.1 aspartate kinase [Chloroflexi bacterium AL-N15]